MAMSAAAKPCACSVLRARSSKDEQKPHQSRKEMEEASESKQKERNIQSSHAGRQ